MAVKLTESQMTTLKSMVEIAERFSDQFLHIMRNSGMDRIPGCQLTIQIDPVFTFTTEMITFGKKGSEAGYIALTKGVYDEPFTATGSGNSAEYELLFADDSIRERMAEVLRKEKPLPPDGLWVGKFDDPSLMDSGVQVNDGLAEQTADC